MLPVFESIRFPALVDPDVEDARDHVFEVRKSCLLGDTQHFNAILDDCPILFEFHIPSGTLTITNTPLDVDVVHPQMYENLRSMFEYATGDHAEEARVVGNRPDLDAHFLPTFGCGGPIVPYVLKNIVATTAVNRVILN